MARVYEYECKKEGDNWVAYISIDGMASLRQENDHRKFGQQPFVTQSEAQEWADDWIARELEVGAKAEIGAAMIAADEELQRAFMEATILQAIIASENI